MMLIRSLPTRLNKRCDGLAWAKNEVKTAWKPPDNWPDFARLTTIRSGTKVVPFQPYQYQIDFIEAVENNYGSVVAKPRQVGLTEAIASWLLWRAFDPGFLGVFLSKGQKDTSQVCRRVKQSLTALIQAGYVALKNDNQTEIELVGGGRVLFRPSTPASCRGLESVGAVVIDEAAHIQAVEQIYQAVLPSTEVTGKDARIVLISTPNGRQGFYYDRLTANNPEDKRIDEITKLMREEAIDPTQIFVDQNGWAKILIHWRANPVSAAKPDYLAEIKRSKQLPDQTIEQEYCLNFLESAKNLFSEDLILAAAVGSYEDEPDVTATYVCGIDPAISGQDYATAVILKTYNGDEFSLVAMHHKNRSTTEANLRSIEALIKKYNPSRIICEKNSIGGLYVESLINTVGEASGSARSVVPFVTTRDSKEVIVQRLNLALELKVLKFPPTSPLVQEMLSFCRFPNGTMGAASGHDDLVISVALALSETNFNTARTVRPGQILVDEYGDTYIF